MRLNNKGFSLIELIVAVGILSGMAALLVPSYAGMCSYLYKIQAQRAAQQMAGDIAALQQYSFYDVSGRSRLEMDKEKAGYRIYHGKDVFLKRNFSAASGLYFSQHLNDLKFSQDGAPTQTLNYIIKCRHDKNISYWLQVQPVTGRVVFK